MSELKVLVPTRARPDSVHRMVEAWHYTGAFTAASLFFIIDKDDAELRRYDLAIRQHPEVRTILMDEWKPMVPKLNEAAFSLASSGSVLGFMGDDHVPRTPNWASRVITAALTNGPSIVYGRDGIQDQRLPTWWAMSSLIVRQLGRMVPADVQHLYCDNAIKVLGEQSDCLRYLPDVMIEHMHPVAGKGQMDPQYERVNRRQQYERDRLAFEAWVKDGLARDASLISDLRG